MKYQTPTYDEVLAAILTDFANQFPGCDTSIGSDIHVKATSAASTAWGEYEHQKYIRDQIFPHSSDTEHLELHADSYHLWRKAPNIASGLVRFTGEDGTAIPEGMQAVTDLGVVVVTNESGPVVDGVARLGAVAAVPGLTGNLAFGTALTVQDPPAGLDSVAEVADSGSGAGFTSGTDLETDEALLARVQDRRSHPPAGGNKHDYRSWALQVPGVVDAYTYRVRPGLGEVTTLILTSGAGAARIPSDELVASALAYLETVRPITVKTCLVLAPTAKSTTITVRVAVISGYNPTLVKGWVTTALTNYVASLAPLETLYVSKLQGVIAEIEGVLDYFVDAPADKVVPVDDNGVTIEMIVPGAITVGDLT